SEPVNALLDGLLRYLPEQCHIILASRGIPRRLTLSRLAARQEVVGLGVNHLRFTEDEIRLVLEALGRDDFTPEQIHLLAERSEGWITGVLLAIQANRWTETTEEIIRLSGTNEGVFDYMASEILEKQDPATRDFLLGSSLLGEMSAPLCDALLGITNSAQILNYLVTQGLFTSRLDAEGIWYRYHQMFREFLSAKLQRDDPALFRRLCLRQAELMANQGRWLQAIEGYLTAGAYEQAADAIEIVAQEMFLSGDRKKFARWVDALPDRILEQHPLLILRRGRVHTENGEWDRAEAMLDRSFRLFMEREDLLNASRALVQHAAMYRLRNAPDRAIAVLQRVREIGGERDTLCAIQVHHNLGICYHMQGRFSESDAELRMALELARRAMDDTNSALIAHDIGRTMVTQGRLLEGRQYFHQALLYWRKIGNLSELSTTLQGLGVVHHYLGQYSEAESRFQESLIKARDHSNRRLEAYALLNLGDLYRDTNQYKKALEAYNQAIEV
ncbi:MAG: tetratricopeptide repeat protein, partial [Chloroflexi bacterium]|nr:tetratricopeptide repeat protein [Chloroflexota bacterium]